MWLAVEGIVGAGKTTTVEAVGAGTDLVAVIERSDQHPLLDVYYQNPRRFAVETELVFLALQANQVRRLDRSVSWVSDYAPAKNLVFARFNCQAPDLHLLKRVEERLWEGLPVPDLTLFLDVPPKVCLERIRRRGRPYEMGLRIRDLEGMRSGYLDALNELGAEVRQVGLEGTESPEQVASVVIAASDLDREA